jgi:hypothetical protein
MNWMRVGALTEDGMKYTQYITEMDQNLKQKGIDFVENKKFARYSNRDEQLEEFKKVS